jgi:hypothetical protein
MWLCSVCFGVLYVVGFSELYGVCFLHMLSGSKVLMVLTSLSCPVFIYYFITFYILLTFFFGWGLC